MVTEIYKQDVRKFIHLVDDRIWKKAIEKKYHMLGSIWETEIGMLPAGVMIYDIIDHPEHVVTSLYTLNGYMFRLRLRGQKRFTMIFLKKFIKLL